MEHLPEIWCYRITYVKFHNVVGVTLNYNKKVIIYMNIQMAIAIVPDIFRFLSVLTSTVEHPQGDSSIVPCCAVLLLVFAFVFP